MPLDSLNAIYVRTHATGFYKPELDNDASGVDILCAAIPGNDSHKKRITMLSLIWC